MRARKKEEMRGRSRKGKRGKEWGNCVHHLRGDRRPWLFESISVRVLCAIFGNNK